MILLDDHLTMLVLAGATGPASVTRRSGHRGDEALDIGYEIRRS